MCIRYLTSTNFSLNTTLILYQSERIQSSISGAKAYAVAKLNEDKQQELRRWGRRVPNLLFVPYQSCELTSKPFWSLQRWFVAGLTFQAIHVINVLHQQFCMLTYECGQLLANNINVVSSKCYYTSQTFPWYRHLTPIKVTSTVCIKCVRSELLASQQFFISASLHQCTVQWIWFQGC